MEFVTCDQDPDDAWKPPHCHYILFPLESKQKQNKLSENLQFKAFHRQIPAWCLNVKSKNEDWIWWGLSQDIKKPKNCEVANTGWGRQWGQGLGNQDEVANAGRANAGRVNAGRANAERANAWRANTGRGHCGWVQRQNENEVQAKQ